MICSSLRMENFRGTAAETGSLTVPAEPPNVPGSQAAARTNASMHTACILLRLLNMLGLVGPGGTAGYEYARGRRQAGIV